MTGCPLNRNQKNDDKMTNFLVKNEKKKMKKMSKKNAKKKTRYESQVENKLAGTDLDYIHLCKCWSHIFGGKIIKKYRNTHFLHKIIVFFSSADRRD